MNTPQNEPEQRAPPDPHKKKIFTFFPHFLKLSLRNMRDFELERGRLCTIRGETATNVPDSEGYKCCVVYIVICECNGAQGFLVRHGLHLQR